MNEETQREGRAFLGEPFLKNIFALSYNSTGCLLFLWNYVVAIIKYSTTRIRHVFCLIHIVEIVVETQIVYLVFQFYFNLLT